MKEVIEDQAHTKLSATESITSWIQHRVYTQLGRFERRTIRKSEQRSHQEYERHTVGTAERTVKRKCGRDFWDEMGKTAGCAACAQEARNRVYCMSEPARVEDQDHPTIRTRDT